MKFLTIFVVFFLSVNLSEQIAKLVNFPSDYVLPSSMANSCTIYTWDGPDSISALGCAQYACAPGTEIGYKKDDNSKTYPECCGGPICAD